MQRKLASLTIRLPFSLVRDLAGCGRPAEAALLAPAQRSAAAGGARAPGTRLAPPAPEQRRGRPPGAGVGSQAPGLRGTRDPQGLCLAALLTHLPLDSLPPYSPKSEGCPGAVWGTVSKRSVETKGLRGGNRPLS